MTASNPPFTAKSMTRKGRVIDWPSLLIGSDDQRPYLSVPHCLAQ